MAGRRSAFRPRLDPVARVQLAQIAAAKVTATAAVAEAAEASAAIGSVTGGSTATIQQLVDRMDNAGIP